MTPVEIYFRQGGLTRVFSVHSLDDETLRIQLLTQGVHALGELLVQRAEDWIVDVSRESAERMARLVLQLAEVSR